MSRPLMNPIVSEGGREVLCACGCGGTLLEDIVYSGGSKQKRRYLNGHQRRGKTFGCFRGQHLARTISPTNELIILAAGWFEGEGWCGGQQVEIAQKDSWMTDRLVAWFGGKVYVREDPPKSPWKSKGPINIWVATGPRARGFLMTIYKFLSPRRQAQVRKCIRSHQSKYLASGT